MSQCFLGEETKGGGFKERGLGGGRVQKNTMYKTQRAKHRGTTVPIRVSYPQGRDHREAIYITLFMYYAYLEKRVFIKHTFYLELELAS